MGLLEELPCVECGIQTNRRCRWKNGKLDRDAPLVPVCYECGPQYKVIAEHIKGFGFVGVAEDLVFPRDLAKSVREE